MLRKLGAIWDRFRLGLALIVTLLPLCGGSLRRTAQKSLGLSRRDLMRQRKDAVRSYILRLGWSRYALLAVVLIGAVWLPIRLHVGLFGHPVRLRSYLQTLWQVLAASLALSVAMIGFVFEAFMNASQRSLGGSLRQFARETGLQWTLSLGFIALVLDGVVLLDVGTNAPAGWSGAVAIAVSGATIGGALPFVFVRTLRSLEFDFLVSMRRRQITRLARDAMRAQLLQQAADAVVHQGQFPGLRRGLAATAKQFTVAPARRGRLEDVRIGRLSKLVLGARPGASNTVLVLAALGDTVGPTAPFLAAEAPRSAVFARLARRTLKVNRWRSGEDPSRRLTEELEKLHEAAQAAIREHRTGDWTTISGIYEEAILTLPRAAAAMNIQFTGAVAAPGLFGIGPVDTLSRLLFREIETALKTDDPEIALKVTGFPVHIAREAAQLNAVGLVTAMLGLHPAIYGLTANP